MLKNWTKIFIGEEEYQAKVIVSLLKKHNLRPVLLDRKDDGFRIGVAEVYVAPEEADKAKKIIDKNTQPDKEH